MEHTVLNKGVKMPLLGFGVYQVRNDLPARITRPQIGT